MMSEMQEISVDPNHTEPKRKRRSIDVFFKRKSVDDLGEPNIYRLHQESSISPLRKKQKENTDNSQALNRNNSPAKPRETKSIYKDQEKELYKWLVENLEKGTKFSQRNCWCNITSFW